MFDDEYKLQRNELFSSSTNDFCIIVAKPIAGKAKLIVRLTGELERHERFGEE